MSRPHLLIMFGLLVALAPFSGLPASWLELLMPIIAVGIVALGYSFLPRKEKVSPQTSETEQVATA